VPYRFLAASKLAEFLSAIAHPRRVQIIEELRSGETDVGALKTTLGVSQSNVSQHLAVLRSHRGVAERREGRHVFYRLCSSELAEWLLDGMRFVPEATEESQEVKNALQNAKLAWASSTQRKQKRKPPRKE